VFVSLQFDSDDEIAAEEEAEALRLQKAQAARLSNADLGLPDGVPGDDSADEEHGSSEDGDPAEPLGARLEVQPRSTMLHCLCYPWVVTV
jgi:hypothetical protein